MSKRARAGGFGAGLGADRENEPSGKRSAAYEILGLPRTASVGEIKKAYRALIINSHPDKNTTTDPEGSKLKATLLNDAYNILKTPDLKTQYDGGLAADHIYWDQQEEDLQARLAAEFARDADADAEEARAAQEMRLREQAEATRQREAADAKRRDEEAAALRQKAQQDREEEAARKRAETAAAELSAAQAAAEALHLQEAAVEAARLKAASEELQRKQAEAAEAKERKRLEVERAAAERIAQAEALEQEITARENKEKKDLAIKQLAKLKRSLGSPDFWKQPISKERLDIFLDLLETTPGKGSNEDEKARRKFESDLDNDNKDEFLGILKEYSDLRKSAGIEDSAEVIRERKITKLEAKLKAIPYFWKNHVPNMSAKEALTNLAKGDKATKREINRHRNREHEEEFEDLFEEWRELNKPPANENDSEIEKMERLMRHAAAGLTYNKLFSDIDNWDNDQGADLYQFVTGKQEEAAFKIGIVADKADQVMKSAQRLKDFFETGEWITPAQKAAKTETARVAAEAEAARIKTEEETRLKAEAERIAQEAAQKQAEEATKLADEEKKQRIDTSKLALSGLLFNSGNEFVDAMAKLPHTRDLEAFSTEQRAEFGKELAKHAELSADEQAALYKKFDETILEKKLTQLSGSAKIYFTDVLREIDKDKKRHTGVRLERELKVLARESRDNFKWWLKKSLPDNAHLGNRQNLFDQLTKLLQDHIPDVRPEKID